MSSIIFQTDKRSGITYAYESTSYRDKKTGQPRAKRKLVGRWDEASQSIVDTDGRMRNKHKQPQQKTRGRPPVETPSRCFYGATYLLDQIGEKLGLTHDLKRCFPDRYQQILSIVYFMIIEDKTPLYRFEKWGQLHKHPFGKNITSARSSDLFASICQAAQSEFFQLQSKRRADKEFWAYDITSISSYSECLRQVQYGKNKDNEQLPQINLALVYGEQSGLPFYYRKLAGNIPDSKTLKHLLKDFRDMGCNKVKLVMDRGFYSQANIDMLLSHHLKFLVSAKMSMNWVKQHLEPIYNQIQSFETYNDQYELYTQTVKTTWQHKQERPRKGDVKKTPKRIYIHYYYNIDQAAEDKKSFDRKLNELYNDIVSGRRRPDREHLYDKYFDIKTTPKRGTKAIVKQEAVEEASKYYGFFVLLTNEPMDAITALQLYRNKDMAEKAFADLKERLNLKRTLVSSEKSLDGKLFVEFVALIFLSYIKKRMQETDLLKQYSMQKMLDKLDVIERFECPGHAPHTGEVLEKQKMIYQKLGVTPPE